MNRTEQRQVVVQQYIDAGQPWPAPAIDIAKWAYDTGYMKAHPADIVRQFAHELSRAMREEYATDPQGRQVRAKHSARVSIGGKQTSLWADWTSPREMIEISLQQRREQIVGDCRQLKTDVDSFNDNWSEGKPIQMVFDFNEDLEELELMSSLA